MLLYEDSLDDRSTVRMSVKLGTGMIDGEVNDGIKPVILQRDNFAKFKAYIWLKAAFFGTAGRSLIQNKLPDFETLPPPSNYTTPRPARDARESEGASMGGGISRKEFMEKMEEVMDKDVYSMEVSKLREDYFAKKQALCGFLMLHISEYMRDLIIAHDDYEQAYSDFNLLKLWEIIVFKSTGLGSSSISVDLSKLVKLKQGDNGLERYINSSRELTSNLMKKEPDSMKLLNYMFDALFITGLNEHEFSSELNKIYAKSIWPDRNELAAELIVKKVNTDAIIAIRKRDNEESLVAANKVKIAVHKGKSRRACFNCGETEEHSLVRDCPYELVKCRSCGERGHLQRFCKIQGAKKQIEELEDDVDDDDEDDDGRSEGRPEEHRRREREGTGKAVTKKSTKIFDPKNVKANVSKIGTIKRRSGNWSDDVWSDDDSYVN